MSNNKMLIDAGHPEETRVVVLRAGRVEEFDFESAARKLLRGNIYLAKVTRVEPSLQAAFVDYGGNRHGFLAFNEIHPDYYQIPVADRQALLDEEAAQEAAEEAAADAAADDDARSVGPAEGSTVDVAELLPPEPEAGNDAPSAHVLAAEAQADDAALAEPGAESGHGDNGRQAAPMPEEGNGQTGPDEAPYGSVDNVVEAVDAAAVAEPEQVGAVGNDDALEEVPSRPRRRMRSYKIQEVIKRRQIILVQVVKEERGTKGAALTTYLSLAGRYTVLMPNTARGGGISRKITYAQDRKRLKAIADELEVPEGMGLIIRTAGAARTKQEIKRDFEYLLRLWESVRDMTLQSTAPSLVYEEGNLIKRSIRDLYTKDVEEIVVAGQEAHREAKEFMRMLMPSHARNVILFEEPEPLFTRYQIERQLNALFSPYVYLRSGGYLVINQTEALVSIDVNSGKATREFSIEETALNTNIEAADEIARQLKLRDLAGLIVIDFIDMEEKRNNRQVERRLKEALRFDRARIQVGRISHFGLLEMSRQRLRTGMLEGSTSQCPHCQGTGIVRSTESVALAVIRGLEDALMSGQPSSLVATTTAMVALYLLNNKRQFILDMEARHGITVTVQASDRLQGANFTIERVATPARSTRRPERSAAVSMDWGFDGESEGEAAQAPDSEEAEPAEAGADENGSEVRDGDGRRSRRRRRRRGRRDERDDREPRSETYVHVGTGDQPTIDENGFGPPLHEGRAVETVSEPGDDEPGSELGEYQGEVGGEGRGGRRGRRRGRRGGRRSRDRQQPDLEGGAAGGQDEPARLDDDAPWPEQSAPSDLPVPLAGPTVDDHVASEGVPSRDELDSPRPERIDDGVAVPVALKTASPIEAAAASAAEPREPEPLPPSAPPQEPVPAAPREVPPASAPVIERVVMRPDAEAARETTPAAEETARPSRRGWWQRRFSGG
jgi:ribonuclease E